MDVTWPSNERKFKVIFAKPKGWHQNDHCRPAAGSRLGPSLDDRRAAVYRSTLETDLFPPVPCRGTEMYMHGLTAGERYRSAAGGRAQGPATVRTYVGGFTCV